MRWKKNFLDESEQHINLMPLLDILFVLLVTYILISPFILSDHIDLAQGRGAPAESSSGKKMHLMLSSEDQIIYEKRVYPFNEVKNFLGKMKQENPLLKIEVSVDKKAHFEAYQTLKLLIEDAGFESMDLLVAGEKG